MKTRHTILAVFVLLAIALVAFCFARNIEHLPMNDAGGTGRFEGAGGAGTLHGEAPRAMPADLIGGRPFEVTTTGTITYAPGRGGQ